MHEVTRILSAIEQGDPQAAEQLLPLVYDELRRLAAEKMAQEKPGQTLQATALVHDAYIRLVDVEKAQHWNSRGHFFAAAAEAMRRILVENARRKHRAKRGGNWDRVSLDEQVGAGRPQPLQQRRGRHVRRRPHDRPDVRRLPRRARLHTAVAARPGRRRDRHPDGRRRPGDRQRQQRLLRVPHRRLDRVGGRRGRRRVPDAGDMARSGHVRRDRPLLGHCRARSM